MDHRRIGRAATGAVLAALALGALQGSAAGAGGAGGDEGRSAAATGGTRGTGGTGGTGAHPAVCVGTRPGSSLPGDPDDTPLNRTLTRIERTAEDHPDVFTGLAVDEAGRATDVYRLPGEGSREFDALLCGSAEKGVTIRLHDTDLTERELHEIHERISEDMERRHEGFEIWMVGLGSHEVVVGVSDAAKARPALEKAYGARVMRHVVIEHMKEQPRLLPQRLPGG
jgi:hypothetical protein